MLLFVFGSNEIFYQIQGHIYSFERLEINEIHTKSRKHWLLPFIRYPITQDTISVQRKLNLIISQENSSLLAYQLFLG